MTYTIPPEAMPMASIVRLHVSRPEKLPQMTRLIWGYSALRFFSQKRSDFCQCPLGLLPGAEAVVPVDAGDFLHEMRQKLFLIGRKSWARADRAVIDFGKWWDSLADPASAVEAVWPQNAP